jgi:hypothetical protein
MFLDKINGMIEWKSIRKTYQEEMREDRKCLNCRTPYEVCRRRLQVVHAEGEFTSDGCATGGISGLLFQRAWQHACSNLGPVT